MGITPDPHENHAQYLKHWRMVLKEDKRAVWEPYSAIDQALQRVLDQ
jgi:antirestriction protein ArdC